LRECNLTSNVKRISLFYFQHSESQISWRYIPRPSCWVMRGRCLSSAKHKSMAEL